MTILNMLSDVKTTRIENAAAAAQTDLDSDVVDMAGFDAARFTLLLGDVTATSALELQIFGNTANSTSSPTPVELTADDVAFTAGASDADNKLMIADVIRPAYRYLFARVKRGTANAVVDGVIVDQYRARDLPVTQGSTVLDSATVGPAV